MNSQHNLPARRLGVAAIIAILALAALTMPALLPGPVSASPSLPGVDADTASPTPVGEPEWDILQYVVDHQPTWTCGPIYGTPGHRWLGCYTGAGHTGTGYVDNYGDPSIAQATWLQKREHAQTFYPIFYDTPWYGYPGYHGEGDVPPYNFFTREDFYWADVRVLGGVSVDDTGFHYAPDMAVAVMNAADNLGYLPPPSPTPTPVCCTNLTAEASALCLWENNVWVGGGVTNNCNQSILGNFQYCLEVAASPSGPWTPLTCGVGQNVYFDVGQNSYGGYYTDGFPHEYSWYRGHMTASSADGCWQAEATTTPAPICFEATPVVTPTFTPTQPPTVEPSITPSITGTSTPIHTSTSTPTSTPSSTSTIEPEWAIMQYVLDHLPQGWTCNPIGGTPGHRTLGCYTGAGHGGSGYADNYGDPAVADANWLQRREHAQSFYPLFEDTSWNGYPGYHGEGGVPPYDFFTAEDYYWAGVRVLGGVRSDDTGYHYAPDVGSAVMNGAEALGYLPPPSPTATPATMVPSHTPTGTPTGILTPVTPTPCVSAFADVPPGSTFYDFVTCLACRGIVGGYGDGTFRPNNNTTRGQISKIVSQSAGFRDDPGAQMFADVPSSNTFYACVNRLAIHGVVNGYPCGGPGKPCGPGNLPYFRPGANTSRGQVSKILSNAAGFTEPAGAQMFEDVAPSSPFYNYIYRLASRGVMSGYPCGGPSEPCNPPGNLPYFRSNNNTTRGQISKIVANTFFPACQPHARR